jgi:hypothetical protein
VQNLCLKQPNPFGVGEARTLCAEHRSVWASSSQQICPRIQNVCSAHLHQGDGSSVITNPIRNSHSALLPSDSDSMRGPSLRATNTFEAICFFSYTRSTGGALPWATVLSRAKVAVAKGRETGPANPYREKERARFFSSVGPRTTATYPGAPATNGQPCSWGETCS